MGLCCLHTFVLVIIAATQNCGCFACVCMYIHLTKTKRGLLAPGMSCERHAGPQYQVIRRMSSWGDRSPELEQVWQFREEVRGARMLAMGL